jgi:uncharacterized repeat protein (TIGR03803 family)
MKRMAYAVALCAITAITLPAQTFTNLDSFNVSDGSQPFGGLIQGTNGDLYGTTASGGSTNSGTIYTVSTSGTLGLVFSFCPSCPANGHGTYSGIIQGTNGALYGTTYDGGTAGGGTVFSLPPGGAMTALYNFCSQSECTDGQLPVGGVIEGTDGNFYGTTALGGANGAGTVFQVTPEGTLTTLHSFCSVSSQGVCADGEEPLAGLIQGTNGNFYGTTAFGGGSGGGTIFEITPTGTLTTLGSFSCVGTGCGVGAHPLYGSLVQAANGDIYGTTSAGGSMGYGTVFSMTAGGKPTTLYNFCSLSGCADGANPYGGLIQATDGNFYGTTYFGGSKNNGTVYKLSSSGALTTLHSFAGSDGAGPVGSPVEDTNGNLYGTTVGGGNSGSNGAVYKVALGLTPFIEPQTTSGAVGAAVKILGSNFTGATKLTFNGVASPFKIVSSTQITTTVPTGATTGTIEVVTPSGTLSSNVPFRVT